MNLTRCTKCILPSSFPKITFNEDGECFYCKIPSQKNLDSHKALPQKLVRASKILVGLSGGRDSTYGAAYLIEKTAAEIVTFTYDWPLVNNLARFNASNLVQLLQLEHVVRTPYTFKQLKYIRKIISAISKKPDLRAIPLLLAPDKYFFLEAKKVAREYGISEIVFCAGNPLEFTDFKSLIAGGRNSRGGMLNLSIYNSLKLLFGMLSAYIYNPRLFLAGIRIPIETFFITYFNRPNITYLFDHIAWNELSINSKVKELGWQGDGEFPGRSWRAGDGTSDFYNYLYRSVLGFDERTCFLANQVRSGEISRKEALIEEGKFEQLNIRGLINYASVVGFNLDEFLRKWNTNLPLKQRRYKRV